MKNEQKKGKERKEGEERRREEDTKGDVKGEKRGEICTW